MMTNEDALKEALAEVPAEVHEVLTKAGYVPTGDAGNLWFYDRPGVERLVFGEDGSDYPMSLEDEFEAYGFDADGEVLSEENVSAGRISDLIHIEPNPQSPEDTVIADLLAALQAAVPGLETLADADRAGWQPHLVAARAAIAKAKGDPS